MRGGPIDRPPHRAAKSPLSVVEGTSGVTARVIPTATRTL